MSASSLKPISRRKSILLGVFEIIRNTNNHKKTEYRETCDFLLRGEHGLKGNARRYLGARELFTGRFYTSLETH